jgi:hypothetical protein
MPKLSSNMEVSGYPLMGIELPLVNLRLAVLIVL